LYNVAMIYVTNINSDVKKKYVQIIYF